MQKNLDIAILSILFNLGGRNYNDLSPNIEQMVYPTIFFT